MKRFLQSIGVVLLMVATALQASAFDVGDYSYAIQSWAGSSVNIVECTGLTTQGKGKANAGGMTVTIPGHVTYNGTKYQVVGIESNAFSGQSGITNVFIYAPVHFIRSNSFNNCSDLTTVTLPSTATQISSNAFTNCSKLKTVNFAVMEKPSDYSPFTNAGSGMTLNIPKASQMSSTLKGMTGYKNFTIAQKDDVCDFTSSGVYLCATEAAATTYGAALAHNMRIVGAYSAALDPDITSVNYTGSSCNWTLTEVAQRALSSNTTVTSIDLEGCTNLTTINAYAFANCTNLTSLKLPKSLTQGSFASCIDGCTKLTSVTINSANTTYATYNNGIYNKALTSLYRVPEGVSGAFYESSFPTTITNVSNYAFYNCKNVTSIFLRYGVKSIGSQAFYYCTGLSSLRVPSSVTSMQSSALQGAKITHCNINMNVTPEGTTDNTITYLYVPYGKTSEYTTAKGWKYSYINNGGQQAFDFDTNNVFYTVTSTASRTANNGSTYAGSVKVVCDGATYGKSSATTVNIPEYVYITNKSYAVTKIGEDAFNSNTGNITITGCVNIDTIGEYAFQNQPVVSYPFTHKLKVIRNRAFQGTSLTGTVQIPYGVKEVGAYAFANGKYERIVVPNTVASWCDMWVNTSTLKEIVYNHNGDYNYSGWDLTGVPSTCYIRVPTGYVNHYKNSSKFSGRSSYVTAGAYDFAYYNNYTSIYYLSIISTSSTTFNGTTYAGKAKYVYHPNIQNSTSTGSYIFSTYEEDRTVSNDIRKYLITQIGDSLLYGSKFTGGSIPAAVTRIGQSAFRSCDYKANNLVLPSGLTFIGHDAFYGSKITGELKVPSSVATLEDYALCSSTLSSIYFPDMTVPTMGTTVWSSSIGKVWVPNNRASQYLSKANGWGSSYGNKINVWIKPNAVTQMFSSVVPVNLSGSNINAYYASNYNRNSTGQEVSLTKANQAPENTGLLLTDLTVSQEYRISRPSGSVSAPMTNYFIGNPSATVNVNAQTVGYYWDANNKKFIDPTTTWNLAAGMAYLKLSTAEASGKSEVYTSLWPYTPPVDNKYDVNGDGEVGIDDVNMIINVMLNKDTNPTHVARADVDGGGSPGIEDVNSVLNYMATH